MTLVERLRRALDAVDHTPVLLPGDQRFAEDVGSPLSAAAVLVAVTDRPEPGVILIQRTDTMRKHAGQVAFPGGRVDPEDADATAAALREAEEEIALPRGAVTVIGAADRYTTGTGYDITPVIGVIAPDLAYHPNEAEVADVFEVPLHFVFDPANQIEAQAEWQGKMRRYYEITWQDRRIWGATAAMMVNLSRRLRWVA
jgi:8-oxo-dGTP pyrophosphatase MutT (NUDIX family)